MMANVGERWRTTRGNVKYAADDGERPRTLANNRATGLKPLGCKPSWVRIPLPPRPAPRPGIQADRRPPGTLARRQRTPPRPLNANSWPFELAQMLSVRLDLGASPPNCLGFRSSGVSERRPVRLWDLVSRDSSKAEVPESKTTSRICSLMRRTACTHLLNVRP